MTSPKSTDGPSARSDMDTDDRVVPMRLQKFLARAGVASRRGSEDLMSAGRVAVNGIVASELGTKVDPSVDVVTLDGREVRTTDAPAYLALHKPVGYVTTMSDPHGRPTVAQLVPTEEYPGLYPIGRLDLETSGLLLFTTDGELGFKLLHPRFHVAKEYTVLVDGTTTEKELDRLREGLDLDDGPTAPADVRPIRIGARSEIAISIREGRKRQIRRMFSAIGHPVLELHRVSFGPISLGELRPGQVRALTAEEIDDLRDAARGEV